jgi:hypothetical protein
MRVAAKEFGGVEGYEGSFKGKRARSTKSYMVSKCRDAILSFLPFFLLFFKKKIILNKKNSYFIYRFFDLFKLLFYKQRKLNFLFTYI